MVQHGVTEDEVEAAVGERQRLRVGAGGSHAESEPLGVLGQGADHAGRDVGAGGLPDDARLQQVEAEVAGSGADLQRAAVTVVELGADELAQLPEYLGLADLAEVDAPLGVVACRGDVVVARVDVPDLLRGESRLHTGAHITLIPMSATAYVQQDQPPGVPPLELTGERTLPDVPAENYWYRRHLAVYEWIAARVAGARRARHGLRRGVRVGGARRLGRRRWSASTPIPRPTSTLGCATRSPGLSFERGLVETWGEPGSFDAVVFLQTIEHVQDPAAVLRHFRALLAPGGVAYVSTPNVLTLAPAGAEKSGNPVAHQGVPRRGVPGAVRVGVRRGRAPRPVPCPQAADPRARAAARMGPGPSGARDHEPLLRPLHAGDRR